MRKVVFGGGNTLENYLARADHSFDWILMGEEAEAAIADAWKMIDSMVMGRRTYEVMLPLGDSGESQPEVETFVCSRTLNPQDHERVTDPSRLGAPSLNSLPSAWKVMT